MTLSEAKCGEVVLIKDFKGDDELQKRLIGMGVRKEESFQVIKRCGRNILIKNENNRLSLNKELANMIEVWILERNRCLNHDHKLCHESHEGHEGHEGRASHKKRCKKRFRWGIFQKDKDQKDID